MKEGEIPEYRHRSGVTEIWKGRHNGDIVALKVLRVARDCPQMQKIKTVSMLRGPQRARPFVVLIDGIAILQGGGPNDAAQARKYPSFLRGVHDGRRPLPGVPLVRQRKYRGLSEREARCQPVRSGEWIKAEPMIPTLSCTTDSYLAWSVDYSFYTTAVWFTAH